MWQFYVVTYKSKKQASIRTQGRAACFPPTLLNVNIKKVLKSLREKLMQKTDVKIRDEKTDMLQFVNNIAVLTHSENNLMEVLGEVGNILTTGFLYQCLQHPQLDIGTSLMSPYLEQYASSTLIQHVSLGFCPSHPWSSSFPFIFQAHPT